MHIKNLVTRKNIAIFLTPFAIAGSLFVYHQKTKTAKAFGNLYVDLGVPSGQPVFTVSGMLPSDCYSRTISVENQGSGEAQILVRSDNVVDNDNLSSVLNLQIIRNSTVLYDELLSTFFNESNGSGGISLSPLPAGETVAYEFKICFDPQAGNEFQNTQVEFDLIFDESHSPIVLPDECSFLSGVIYTKLEGNNIRGTNENELIIGTDGRDKLDGGGGDDCIVGKAGNDKLEGGAGNDVILGGDGDDKIDGDSGSDKIYGGNGNDELIGGSYNDVIYGGEGNDNIDGKSGDDYIYAGLGNDQIDGGSGSDHVYGEEDNDNLDGETGNDYLDGGPNNDYAKGSTGVDTCIAETRHKSCEN